MGVRRRGSGLSPGRAAPGRTPPAFAAALLLAALAGCSGLTESEEGKLGVHVQNARSYFEQADYQRALHQATLALEMRPGDPAMSLVRGHALLRLGTAARNPGTLDDSIATFEELIDSDPDDDRFALGAAGAHLGRALVATDEIESTRGRLSSEFLDATARGPEERRLAQQEAGRKENLVRAEELLREVLEHPLQKDNPIALTDLVLVLHAEEGRDAEALPLAERALELLEESNRITETTLEKDVRLDANARLRAQQKLKMNDEKELALRDLLAQAALARGDTEAYLKQMAVLESRAMLGEAEYFNRAGVYEQIGRLDLAIADLESFLRLRSRRFKTYTDDEMAPQIFERLETLRDQQAAAPR